jgi:hypothetical protein
VLVLLLLLQLLVMFALTRGAQPIKPTDFKIVSFNFWKGGFNFANEFAQGIAD